MKKLATLAIVATLLGACGAGAETDELSTLRAEKDSLKTIKTDIGARLAEIELEISKLDTTKVLPLVSEQIAGTKTFEHFFKVYGSLETDQNATIYPEVSGAVLDIKVEEGQEVRKGQILVVLDVEIMKEQEAELKTRLELAKTTYDKQKQLWDKNIGSEMQYLQAKNNYEALQNNLSALQAQIAKGNIQAPYAGFVDEVFIKAGEVAMPGGGILRLINVSNMYIEADISENYLGKVKKGDKVMVSIPSLGVEKLSTIARLGQYINPNNRTFKIRVNVNNEDRVLKPNLVALININDFTQDSAVVISSGLVMEGAANKQYVYLLKDSAGTTIAKKQMIEVGMNYKGESLILSGLKEGDRIVDKGARSIKDGELVTVRK